jgi:CheY-like chemotaxis protein
MPTVLFVDSDEDSRVMYREYFSILKVRTIESDTTADALALAHTADVVVTGLRVAGPFDGIELIRRIRSDRRTSEKPIIVLTAWHLEPDWHRASAAGCDGFLLKPCLPDALFKEIQRVITMRCSRSPRMSLAMPPTIGGKPLGDHSE